MHNVFFMAAIGKKMVDGKIEPLCQVALPLKLENLDAGEISNSTAIRNEILKLFLHYCAGTSETHLGEESGEHLSAAMLLDLYNKASGTKICVTSINQFVNHSLNPDSDSIECTVVIKYRRQRNDS
jgi:hypothetical protein